MNHRSIASDVEIVRGFVDLISLNGKNAQEQYEAFKQLGDSLDSRLTEFGNNVEASLDENVKSLLAATEEKQAVKIITEKASDSVSTFIDRKIRSMKVRTHAYFRSSPYTDYQKEGTVEVGVYVMIYSNMKNGLGQGINDYRRFSNMLSGIHAINIKGPGLNGKSSLKRTKGPEHNEFNPPLRVPDNNLYTVGILALYTEVFPKEVLMSVYNNHMQKH